MDALIFPEVWANVIPIIQDLPLVAHNIAFEKSCLKSVFNQYEIEYPNYVFLDTLKAAKKHFIMHLTINFIQFQNFVALN